MIATYPPMLLEHTHVGRVVLVETDDKAAAMRKRGVLAYGPSTVEVLAAVNRHFPGSRVESATRRANR